MVYARRDMRSKHGLIYYRLIRYLHNILRTPAFTCSDEQYKKMSKEEKEKWVYYGEER